MQSARRRRRQGDLHLHPDAVRFYLGEEPLLQTSRPGRAREDALGYVLDHLPELVVKEVNGSGGYGMLVGPTRRARSSTNSPGSSPSAGQFHRPANAGALHLSDFRGEGIAPRHVDLRPFVLQGPRTSASFRRPHARRHDEKSLIVNSSQGGGTKDTWVIDDVPA